MSLLEGETELPDNTSAEGNSWGEGQTIRMCCWMAAKAGDLNLYVGRRVIGDLLGSSLPDQFRRHTTDDRERLYILRHHRTCRDDRVRTDPDILQNYRVRSDPDIIFDHDLSADVPLGNDGYIGSAVCVIACAQNNVVSDHHVVADFDSAAFRGADTSVRIDGHIIANPYTAVLCVQGAEAGKAEPVTYLDIRCSLDLNAHAQSGVDTSTSGLPLQPSCTKAASGVPWAVHREVAGKGFQFIQHTNTRERSSLLAIIRLLTVFFACGRASRTRGDPTAFGRHR